MVLSKYMKSCNGYNNFFACDHTYCFQQFAPKVEKNFIILHISDNQMKIGFFTETNYDQNDL